MTLSWTPTALMNWAIWRAPQTLVFRDTAVTGQG